MAKISASVRRIEGRIKPENNIEYLVIKEFLDTELKLCPEHSCEYTEVDGYIIIETEDPDEVDMFPNMIGMLERICEDANVKHREE